MRCSASTVEVPMKKLVGALSVKRMSIYLPTAHSIKSSYSLYTVISQSLELGFRTHES